jgi:8-oxo-dGTP pyrophosphatase MutT (NUDIX family)
MAGALDACGRGADDVMSDDAPLYERDPQAFEAYLAEGNRTQARKRVSADVLFRDDAGGILLVDPRYKPGWDLPGGMAEANESPLDAAKREVREELGIEYRGGRPLVIDWVPAHRPWDDSLAFIFDGGVLAPHQRQRIRLNDGELTRCRFCVPSEAVELLRQHTWRRVDQALAMLASGSFGYLHDGHRV